MEIGNILSLQTAAAHGAQRPLARPVQPAPWLTKKSSSSSSSSSASASASDSDSSASSSYSSSSSNAASSVAAARCTRCRRSISRDGGSAANAVSFGSHLHYCSSCTAVLESRALK